MEQLISDYQNGNLTEAKRRAKRVSVWALLAGLRKHGYSYTAAEAIAFFLKGHDTFQAACDAEAAERASV